MSIFTVYEPNEEFHRTEYDAYIHEHRFHFFKYVGLNFSLNLSWLTLLVSNRSTENLFGIRLGLLEDLHSM